MHQGLIEYSAGNATDAIQAEIEAWQNENKLHRLWERDPTLWTNTDEHQWMGWLTIARENQEIVRIENLANEIKTKKYTDIVVLGMGGSSLCPAMMAETFGKIDHYPRLHILDSTDPLQIRHLENAIDLTKTLFIVSSKSGSTLEPNIFKNYFYAQLQTVLNQNVVSDHFIAITDPHTSLEKMAKNEHFSEIFHGVPSIGGRYSALSNFGMVPSGLMGVDIKTFLHHAESMRASCEASDLVKNNSAVILGIILGICAKQGKNKVTLIASPAIHSLGGWLEQLLAESTGKQGKGLIPIDQESLGTPSVYGQDRVFIYIRLDNNSNDEQDKKVQALLLAGFVVVKLTVPDKMHLGAELFRWEIATAVAGSILGINPFNQPDVEDSKVLTAQLTDQYEHTGQLHEPKAFFSDGDISLFTDEKNQRDLTAQLTGQPSLVDYLRAHLNRVHVDDYVDLSAFIEMSAEHTEWLQRIRVLIRDNKKVATCLGFGPRFLHSTGQAYKGGPNTGVFLQITADAREDLSIPGHSYSFGLVISAQAQGDFTVLAQRGRRILRIHLGKNVESGLQKLEKNIRAAM